MAIQIGTILNLVGRLLSRKGLTKLLAVSRLLLIGGPDNSAQATSGLSDRDARIRKLQVGASSNKAIVRAPTVSFKIVTLHMEALLSRLNTREPDPDAPLGT
jgi:hypothetical protein